MSGGSWKVAYSDFVTALMAFFLLMWIVSLVPPEKKQAMAVYFAEPGGYNSAETVIDLTAPPPLSDGRARELTPSETLSIEIQRYLKDRLLSANVANEARLSATEAGVMLRGTGHLIFPVNSVDYDPAGQKVLDAVAEVMRHFKVNLLVRGHCSSDETGAPRLYSKWELSAARAAMATQYLIEYGMVPAAAIQSGAYADTKPVVPDANGVVSVENRRVEFLFYRPELRLGALGF